MAARWPVLVAAVVISGVVVWFARGQGREQRPAATGTPGRGSAGLTPPPRAAVSAPAGPTVPLERTTPAPQLPATPPGVEPPAIEPPSAATVFEAEPRDERWAPRTETELRRRFAKVRGAKLTETECRSAQCRLVVTGSEADVGTTIADLEGARGLHGFASTLLLTAPRKQPDGTIVLHAFAQFDR